MGYACVTIHRIAGSTRTGVCAFQDPMNLNDICMHAYHLAAEVLARSAIGDVTVQEVLATDPAVIALILGEEKKKVRASDRDGTHPRLKRQNSRSLH